MAERRWTTRQRVLSAVLFAVLTSVFVMGFDVILLDHDGEDALRQALVALVPLGLIWYFIYPTLWKRG